MKSSPKIWDICVIGGGPAGMMAAGQAAKNGKSVILLEKNSGLGAKLLITGGGRCNVTNYELDIRAFLKKYKENDKFLFSAFSQFSTKDTLEFFNTRGVPTKVEAEGRVFPESNKAESIWTAVTEFIHQNKVHIETNASVTKIISTDNEISSVTLKNGKEFFANKFILATGGTSRPETGSTGDGFPWLKNLGHTVVASDSALVPISIQDVWVKKLQGITLTDVKITTYQNNTKQDSKKGKVLFTHFGITGPTVLNMSKDIGELLKYGEVEIRIDLLPKLDHGMLNTKLQELFRSEPNKKIKNGLNNLIPTALVEPTLILSEIDGDIKNNSVSKEMRVKLIESLKNMRMQVAGLLGNDKAIVSSGGVALDEVDFKTMQSKIIPNLYLVGDVLNIDRPSGGYSLQLCWTTGFVAGNNA
ncbi:MAG: NAD(P)/FAD-dependent oxidoreductase [bacterium]